MRVRSGVLSTAPVTFRAVATVWTRNPEKKDNYKSTTRASQLLEGCSKKCQDGGQAFWVLLTTSDLSFEARLNQFPGAWIDFIENVSRCCLILTLFQTTYCLSNRADASSKSRRARFTRMNLVSRKIRMSAEGVLLRNTQPN